MKGKLSFRRKEEEGEERRRGEEGNGEEGEGERGRGREGEGGEGYLLFSEKLYKVVLLGWLLNFLK